MKVDPAAKAAAKTAIQERRRKVAALALARVPQQEIAQKLEVSEATISKDLAAIRAVWRAEAVADVATATAQERAALDADERSLRTQMAGVTAPLVRAALYDRVFRIMERRAKLLGLDAPTKIAPTTPDGAAPYTVTITTETIEAAHARMAEWEARRRAHRSE